MNKYWLLAMLGCLSGYVQASYVESCLITGTVLAPTSTRTAYIAGEKGEYEQSDLHLSLRINKVQVDGRADSRCQQFQQGQKLNLSITSPPRISLNKGQTVRVNYRYDDGNGLFETIEYRLLTE